jgi:hypothetical protein
MPGLVGINNPGIPLGGFAQVGPQSAVSRAFGRAEGAPQGQQGVQNLFAQLLGGKAPGGQLPQLPQQQQLPGGFGGQLSGLLGAFENAVRSGGGPTQAQFTAPAGLLGGQQNDSPFRRGVGTRVPGRSPFRGRLG